MIVHYILVAIVIQGGLTLKSRVIHGDSTVPHQFPHHVAIFVKKLPLTPEYFYCGGSIIAPEWILTAGNCIPNVGKLTVKAGKHYININESYQQNRRVAKYIVHEQYVRPKLTNKFIAKNNIAILQLESPLIFNYYIKPINLPSFHIIENNFGEFCGWGSISDGLFPKYPEELQSTELEVIDNYMCNDAINSGLFDNDLFKVELNDEQLCTSYNELGAGPCVYDTGSAFIQYNDSDLNNISAEVIGIFSWAKLPCGKFKTPAIYTRVSSYVNWIKMHMSSVQSLQ